MLAAWNEAVDFLTEVDQINDVPTLTNKFKRGIDPHGLDSFVCSGSLATGKTLQYNVMVEELPDGFLESFEQECMRNDPSSYLLMSSNKPFIWSELGARLGSASGGLKKTAAVANSFGMSDGICVPIHHPGGYVGAMGLAGPTPKISRETAMIIQMMSIHFHDRVLELSTERERQAGADTPRHKDGSRLSPRERECVGWVAEGKTDWDIGEILGISQSTAHFHIENAKKKLKVPTRVQLVVKAISGGELQI